MSRLGHQPALDGLRGLAVAMVVLTHTGSIDPHFRYLWLARKGFLGVDVFFVLSGFLITSLLLEEHQRGRVSFGGFYLRRARRLLPALVFLLTCLAIYAEVSGLPRRPIWTNIWSSLLYVRNYVIVRVPRFTPPIGLGHLWSLSVEEQFYLVFPAVLVALLLTRRVWVAPAVIAVMAVGLEIHRATYAAHRYPLQLFSPQDRTEFRADALLIGALAALVWHHQAVSRRALVTCGWVAVPAFVWVLWRDDHTKWMWGLGFPIFDVAVALLILAAVAGWRGARAFTCKPLTVLGLVSYGLYLWHLPMFAFVLRYKSGWPAWERFVAAYCLAALATGFSYRFVEQPFRRRRVSRPGSATRRAIRA